MSVPWSEALEEADAAPSVVEGSAVAENREPLGSEDDEKVAPPLPLCTEEGEAKEAVEEAVPHMDALPVPPLTVALAL